MSACATNMLVAQPRDGRRTGDRSGRLDAARLDVPPGGLTAADYEALPEEVRRRIEIVDGAVFVTPAPRKPHQRVVRRLATYAPAGVDIATLAVTDPFRLTIDLADLY